MVKSCIVGGRGERFYIIVYAEAAQAFLRRDELGSRDDLRVSDGTDFQRELRAFMFLSEDHGDLQSWSGPPDLRKMICLGDVVLLYESHQERLYLHEAAKRVVFSVPEKRMT